MVSGMHVAFPMAGGTFLFASFPSDISYFSTITHFLDYYNLSVT